MKTNLSIVLLLLVLSGCASRKDRQTMSGIYRIESTRRQNSKTDTLIAEQNQFKLYTNDFYAYANLTNDTSVSFGIGHYSLNGDHLVEHNLFSTGMLDTAQAYDLQIERTEQGYRQLIENIQINGLPTRLMEEYISIPAVGASPLDGTWKLASFCKVTAKDSVCEPRKQYKIFHKGYFMFLQGIDRGTYYSKSFGFGHFDFTKNSLSETNLFTSFTRMADQQVNIQVDFKNPDEFVQTISSDLDSATVIERYIRLKSE